MPAPTRLRSLDVFRGLTIALMILVNSPGSWSHVYAPLLHAEWDGMTLTDLVFPNFVFIVGVSLTFSLSRVGWAGERTPEQTGMIGATGRKVLRRVCSIFVVGLLLNWFPFFQTHVSELRIYGVLQRIALAYGLAAAIVLLVPRRAWLPAAGALLMAYWAAMWGLAPGSDPLSLEGNLKRAIDLATVGPAHMYTGFDDVPFDPEGLIGLVPTAATMLFGAYAALLLRGVEGVSAKVKRLSLYGVVLLAVGLLWNFGFPINKPLWSSSYACAAGGDRRAGARGLCPARGRERHHGARVRGAGVAPVGQSVRAPRGQSAHRVRLLRGHRPLDALRLPLDGRRGGHGVPGGLALDGRIRRRHWATQTGVGGFRVGGGRRLLRLRFGVVAAAGIREVVGTS